MGRKAWIIVTLCVLLAFWLGMRFSAHDDSGLPGAAQTTSTTSPPDATAARPDGRAEDDASTTPSLTGTGTGTTSDDHDADDRDRDDTGDFATGDARPRAAPPVRTDDGLPLEAHDTLRLIAAGGPFPHRQDGSVFQNRENRLPRQPRGWYHEYTVRTPGSRDRGARRIVTGGEPPREYFYTDDHYRSFRRIPPSVIAMEAAR